MNTPNIFSVILLVHNNLEYLPEAIDSVLSQDYPAIELIIADDYSDSFDSAAVEAYLAAHGGSNLMRALVYQNPENLGTVRNFNRAVGQARGAYLKGLAADDALYAPNVLSQAQRALDDSSDGIIASRVMRCSQRMKPLALFRDRFLRSLDCRSSQEIWKALCVHNELPSTGIFFTRVFWETYGPFDESYRLLEDWPTWLRISRRGCRIAFGNFIAAKYRLNSGSATSTNLSYLADKRRAFEREIYPYRREIGPWRYSRAVLNMKIRDSLMVRRIYNCLFRR